MKTENLSDAMKLEMWLEDRGLDPELATRMGWDAKTGKNNVTWLRIPYVRNGEVQNEQYRSLSDKTFRFKAGAEIDLWNADILYDESVDGEPLVIAEGACDGLACIQAGFVRTIAVPGWSKNNTDAADYTPFQRHEEALKRAKTIVICQHDDDAGASMLRGVSTFLDEQDLAYVRYPKGAADANDVLRDFGAPALKEMLDNPRRLTPPGGTISGFSDRPPEAPRQVWKTGLPELEKLVAFRSRAISVVTGKPGGGKTTLVTWLMHHLVRTENLRIGLCLFETDASEVEAHLLRLNGVWENTEEEKRAEVMKQLDKSYRIVCKTEEDEDGDAGMLWLKRFIRQLAREGCKVIVIDPWNEIEHQLLPGESMANYLNVALKKLRQWAARYDVHVVIVAHPRKLDTGKPPTGYDIADSAAWYNKPDLGLTVHASSDKYYGEHTLLVNWKTRNRQTTGTRPGRVRLEFDEGAMVYRPAVRVGNDGAPPVTELPGDEKF